MKKGRYAWNQLRSAYNREVKKQYKITTKEGYEALKDEALTSLGETGHRHYEIAGYITKSGNAVVIDF